jgi:uncharacterized protein (DUF1501 family)
MSRASNRRDFLKSSAMAALGGTVMSSGAQAAAPPLPQQGA